MPLRKSRPATDVFMARLVGLQPVERARGGTSPIKRENEMNMGPSHTSVIYHLAESAAGEKKHLPCVV